MISVVSELGGAGVWEGGSGGDVVGRQERKPVGKDGVSLERRMRMDEAGGECKVRQGSEWPEGWGWGFGRRSTDLTLYTMSISRVN